MGCPSDEATKDGVGDAAMLPAEAMPSSEGIFCARLAEMAATIAVHRTARSIETDQRKSRMSSLVWRSDILLQPNRVEQNFAASSEAIEFIMNCPEHANEAHRQTINQYTHLNHCVARQLEAMPYKNIAKYPRLVRLLQRPIDPINKTARCTLIEFNALSACMALIFYNICARGVRSTEKKFSFFWVSGMKMPS